MKKHRSHRNLLYLSILGILVISVLVYVGIVRKTDKQHVALMQTKQQLKVQPSLQTKTPQSSSSQTSTVSPTPTPAAKSSQPTNSVNHSAPVSPAPEYGPEPNNPDIYQVFNTSAVMTSAGISSDQQTYANQLISSITDWQYYSTANSSLNLCAANPPQKMQSYGSDYLTNPVTQLEWCNNYVQERDGNWQTALSNEQAHHSF